MTNRTAPNAAPTSSKSHDWRAAGAAWGTRAADWAYLAEPGFRRLYQTVHDRVGVSAGTLLLDVACGAGLALQLATERGALASGLDASPGLLAIARARSPRADLREGTMFDLPFPDASFDVVTSFNGIWAGCDEALAEVRRVLRPDGTAALAFWSNQPCANLEIFRALQALQAATDAESSRTHLEISVPGVAEAMLESAGFVPTERDTVEIVSESPDPQLAWRAWSAAGPAFAAIGNLGEPAVRDCVLAVLEPLHDPHIGSRAAGYFDYVIATLAKPSS